MKGTEQELIAQLVSQNTAEADKGWQTVYKQFFPMVRELVLKSAGTDQDAIDVFQDGLLVLNKNLRKGSFRGESLIKTYLYSICKNLWLKELQKRQKQTAFENDIKNHLEQERSYLANVEVVSSLMNELKEECRKILTEFYYNNRSMEELKTMFNVNSIQAAKNKKWRCLGYLVKLFKERGITYMQVIESE